MSTHRLAGTLLLLVVLATAPGQPDDIRSLVSRLREQAYAYWGLPRAITEQEAREGFKLQAEFEQVPHRTHEGLQGDVFRLRIICHLGLGDVRGAQAQLKQLEQQHPRELETLRPTWTVAMAAGDAQGAQQALQDMLDHTVADRGPLKNHLARLAKMGQPAPYINVTTDDGQTVRLRDRRDKVLLLDFWSVTNPYIDRHRTVLRDLQHEYAGEANLEFLSINYDEAIRIPAARDRL
jgi:hypothetical protein